MQASALGVIADFDFSIGKLTQFLNRLDIGCAHIGSGDNSQFSAILSECGQLIHQKTQTAPFDERNKHINSVAGNNLFFKLCKHLRLVDCAGEQTALRNGSFGSDNFRLFIESEDAVLLIKKRKKLFRTLCNGEFVEISFIGFFNYCCNDFVHKLNLRRNVTAVITHIVKPFFDYFGYVFCKNLRRLRSVDGRNLSKLVRCRKLRIKCLVDYLLIKSILKHNKTLFIIHGIILPQSPSFCNNRKCPKSLGVSPIK